MSDSAKELEIKLKATGGAEAAQEVEKVSDAVEGTIDASTNLEKVESDLGKQFDETRAKLAELKDTLADGAQEVEAAKATEAQDAALKKLGRTIRNLIPGYGSLMSKVTELKGAWVAASASGTSFGSKLLALAGGPVAIAVAAVAGVIAMFVSYRKEVEANEKAIDDLFTATGDYIDELSNLIEAHSTTGTSSDDLGDRLGDLSEETDTLSEAWRIAVERAEALKAAQDDLAKDRIDARVESGEISAEEGQAQKGEIDIAAGEREVALKTELAAKAKEIADVEAERARSTEAAAKAELAAANAAVVKVGEDGRRRQADATAKASASRAIEGQDFFGDKAGAAANTVDLAGGEDAARGMLEEMDGIRGKMARFNLALGATVEEAIGPFEAAAIVAKLAEEATTEAAAAKASSKESTVAAKKIVEEKKAQLAAVTRLREAAEKEANKAQVEVEGAASEATVAEVKAPIAQRAVDAARERDAARMEKEKADAAAEAERRAQTTESVGISGDVARLGRNGAANGVDPATVKALDAAAGKLGDGTNFNELNSVLNTLAGAVESADAKHQAALEAKLAPIIQRINNLASRLGDK